MIFGCVFIHNWGETLAQVPPYKNSIYFTLRSEIMLGNKTGPENKLRVAAI